MYRMYGMPRAPDAQERQGHAAKQQDSSQGSE